jgi:hypothetical protein
MFLVLNRPHPSLNNYSQTVICSVNNYSRRQFQPDQADALSPGSSANESACAVENLCSIRRAWNFPHSAVSNELRNAYLTSLRARRRFSEIKKIRKLASPS